jgi:DivIVA domain-containing protein
MLSAEDIVNKQFKTKRDGYDPDDVDDFLDEVVKELRRIQIENDGLSQKVLATESRVAELQRSGGPIAAASPIAGGAETGTTSQLLQLARKLHDQHIQEGYTERDRIIEEGKNHVTRMLAEAELRQRNEINVLDQQRIAVEREIERLKQFEKEYRQHLKQHLEKQLADLANSGQESANSF